MLTERKKGDRLAMGFLLLFFSFISCSAQTRVSAISSTINSTDGYPLTVYELFSGSTYRVVDNPRAVFFYIQGSEYNSVVQRIDMLASAVILGGRCILMEKRGCSYNETDTVVAFRYAEKKIRVQDHLAVIRAVTKNLEAKIPVIVIGGSEGGDVAAELAERENRITQLILIGSGGGWSQKKELEYLVTNYPGYLGCNNTRVLDSVCSMINNSANDSLVWAGHPYRRWKSFLDDPGLLHLKHITIPVLLLHGDADTNVPVGSARALNEAFRDLHKENLTYIEYPGVDHRLNSTADHKSRYPLLEIDIMNWLSRFNVISGEEVKLFRQRVKRAHKELFD